MDAIHLCSLVDHTLLKPEATRAQIEALCSEALDLRTKTVCVNPLWVGTAARALADSDIEVCSVVGFPLGATSPASLEVETATAISDGASEIDMVIPVGLVKDGSWTDAGNFISVVRGAARQGVVLKVILETALLADDEVAQTCKIAVDSGADFVKTSTGFNQAGGATVAAVRLMRDSVGPEVGVKAAGGIRTLDDALALLNAGANRLGMSATRSIVAELQTKV